MRQRTRMKMRRFLPALAAALFFGACGCGKTATVAGKVSYQGHAFKHGSVLILDSDNTTRSRVIKPDSSYVVEGVKPGEVRIGVISHDPYRGGRPGNKGNRAAAQKRATGDWFP